MLDSRQVLGYFYQDSSTSSYQHKDVYTYDALNRLTNSTATAVSPGTASYNLSYSYDRYGNRPAPAVRAPVALRSATPRAPTG